MNNFFLLQFFLLSSYKFIASSQTHNCVTIIIVNTILRFAEKHAICGNCATRIRSRLVARAFQHAFVSNVREEIWRKTPALLNVASVVLQVETEGGEIRLDGGKNLADFGKINPPSRKTRKRRCSVRSIFRKRRDGEERTRQEDSGIDKRDLHASVRKRKKRALTLRFS